MSNGAIQITIICSPFLVNTREKGIDISYYSLDQNEYIPVP